MPFLEVAGRCFTAVSVQKNAPELSGVYGLSNGREWLFIGESNNIRAQLLEHLRQVSTVLDNQKPTGFTFELCPPGERISRQNALIRELAPRFNRRMG